MALFGADTEVRLSDLKNKFYKKLPGLRDELYGMLVSRGFYTRRPDRVRSLYVIAGAIGGGALAAASGTLMTKLLVGIGIPPRPIVPHRRRVYRPGAAG